MNQKKLATTISAIFITTLLTGCLGGGGGSSSSDSANADDKYMKKLGDGVTTYDSRMWQFASTYKNGEKPSIPEYSTAEYAQSKPVGVEVLPFDLYEHDGMLMWEEGERENLFGTCNATLVKGEHSWVYGDSVNIAANLHTLVTAIADQSAVNMMAKMNINAAALANLAPAYSSEDLWRLMNIWVGTQHLIGGVVNRDGDFAEAWTSLGTVADHAGFDIGGLKTVFPIIEPEGNAWDAADLKSERLNMLYGWYQTLTLGEKKQWAKATQDYMDSLKTTINAPQFDSVHDALSIRKIEGVYADATKVPVCISSKLPKEQVALATKYGVVVANPNHIPSNVLQNAIRREVARYGIRTVAGVSDHQKLEYWLEAGLANQLAGFDVADRADSNQYHPMKVVDDAEYRYLGDNGKGESILVGHASYQAQLSKAAEQIENWNINYATSGNYEWIVDLLFTMRSDVKIWQGKGDEGYYFPSMMKSYEAMERAFNQNYFNDGALSDYGYTTLKEIKNNYFSIAM